MARVPYNPVPTAQPQDPGEAISVNTPGAAFGENIGAAISHLGTTVGQVGDELFTRALALQDLQNQSDARNAVTGLMDGMAKSRADYLASKEKDAVSGLQPYLKSSDDMHKQFRSTLTSPMAQRYFDQESSFFMRNNVLAASAHAGQEGKNYIVGTADAAVNFESTNYTDPKNDIEFGQKVGKIKQQAGVVAGAQGWSDEQQGAYTLGKISQAWRGRLTTLAQTDPQAAYTMLQQATQTHQINQDDADKAEDVILSRNRAVGTTVIAKQVYDPTKPFADMLREGQEIIAKNKADHGDPLFEKDFETTLRTMAISNRYVTAQDKTTQVNTLQQGIVSGVTNMQELLAQPGMQQAYDHLLEIDPKTAATIPAQINSYHRAVTEAVREQGDKTLTRLRGLKSDNVEEFLNETTNAAGIQGLTQPQIRQVMQWRDQLTKNPQDDPRTLRAIGWMREAHGSELEALGITKRTEDNKDEYDHYIGAMEGAIEAWTETNKRPPTYEEIVNKIGPQLIKSVSTPGTIFGNVWPNSTKFYDTLDTQISAAKAEAVKRGIEPPTDNEVRKAYLSQMFQKLYGGSGGGAGPTPPGP